LDAREQEALKGAGLLLAGESSPAFAMPRRITEFRDALARVLSDVVTPQPELGTLTEGVWTIERRIRRSLRARAIQELGQRWRSQLLHGNLAGKVLERARLDSHVTAASVAELRDPIEWLSLGELLEVVQAKPFDGLAFDNVSWKLFTRDMVPIRNRLSHMRLVRKGDAETVNLWLARVNKSFE
jgi:hypothetical protein